jgi:hypothetical protein
MDSKDTYWQERTYRHLSSKIYSKEITFERAVEIINRTSIMTIYEKMEVIESLKEQFNIKD